MVRFVRYHKGNRVFERCFDTIYDCILLLTDYLNLIANSDDVLLIYINDDTLPWVIFNGTECFRGI